MLEGSTPEEVIALAQGGGEAIIPLLTKASFLRSFNPIAPGAENWAYVDLRTGVFVVDATEHVEGMPVAGAPHLNASFTANEIVGTVTPQADVAVEMVDFAYAMPDEIPAGPQLWEFTNNGEQWHMMFVIDLAEGAGVEDVMAFLGDPARCRPARRPSSLRRTRALRPSARASASGWSSACRLASTWSAARSLTWRRSSQVKCRCRTSSTAW